MHYYIDGYNLLFRSVGAGIADLKLHRESLIQSLNIKVASLKLDVTIVFDSQYFPGDGSRSHFKHLEICFTPIGITADEYILLELQHCKAPQSQIVVTSDRDLAYKARNLSAGTESVDEFLGWMNKRYKKKQTPEYQRLASLPKKKPAHTKETETKEKEPDNSVAESDTPKPQKIKAPPDGTLEFYLLKFEEKLEAHKELASSTRIKSESMPKRNIKKHNLKPKFPKTETDLEHVHLTEDERWLKIFQNRLDKQS